MDTRILRMFDNKGIVKLLNPEKKTGRFYTLTELGEILKKELE